MKYLLTFTLLVGASAVIVNAHNIVTTRGTDKKVIAEIIASSSTKVVKDAPFLPKASAKAFKLYRTAIKSRAVQLRKCIVTATDVFAAKDREARAVFQSSQRRSVYGISRHDFNL
jgi:hypothetical protein